MTVTRIDIINNLEKIIHKCHEKRKCLLKEGIQYYDARVTFYSHYINTLDATLHLMILLDKYFRNDDDFELWDQKLHNEYNVKGRHNIFNQMSARDIYKKELEYVNQHLLYSFFIFIFHSFEHSLNIISKNCFPDIYYKQKKENDKKLKKNNFKNILEIILKESNLLNRDRVSFTEIIVAFRNSIHNNGVYTNDSDQIYHWKCEKYEFKNGKQIKKDDLWDHYIKFTEEFIDLFDRISSPIDKGQYIEDITESK